MNPALHELPDRLKMLRQKRGLSVAQLAQSAGIEPTVIEQLENGQEAPNIISTLATIASALSVPVAELLGGVPYTDTSRRRELPLSRPNNQGLRGQLSLPLGLPEYIESQRARGVDVSPNIIAALAVFGDSGRANADAIDWSDLHRRILKSIAPTKPQGR